MKEEVVHTQVSLSKHTQPVSDIAVIVTPHDFNPQGGQ
jgi:hypothetical protein